MDERKRKRAAQVMLLSTCIICMLLAGARVAPASGTREAYLPILMYHQLSEKPSRWNTYVLPPDAFEQDILLLRRRGYTPVAACQILRFVQGTGTLPDKPVLITFDDGDSSFYRLAWPIIQRLELPVLLSPVGKWAEAAQQGQNAQYMTLQQIGEVAASGLVEIGNHTYNMHRDGPNRKGVLRKTGESMAQYRNALMHDVGKAQALWADVLPEPPAVFTYPFGFLNDSSEAVLKEMGFQMTLSCYETVSRISDGQSLRRLGRFNRAGDLVSEAIVSKLDRCLDSAQAGR